MTEQQINEVCLWLSQGAKVKIAQHYSGRRRVKVVHGPFGLKTVRFNCLEDDIQRLMSRIREQHVIN